MSQTPSDSSSSIDRKTLKRPDEFTASLRRFFDTLAKRSGVVLSLVGLLIAIGVGATLMFNERKSKSTEARDALYHAEKSLEQELTKIAESKAPPAPPAGKDGKAATVPPASATAVAFQSLDVDAQLGESVKRLEKIISDFPSTQAAQEARFTLGELYFNHGSAEKAASWFTQAASEASKPYDKTLALISVGLAHENANKPKEAVKSFESALKLKEPSLKGNVLLHLARSYQQAGDLTRAHETYDQVLSQLPNTEHAKNAEALKAQLN